MTPSEAVDPPHARRHMNEVRRLVLEIIADNPSIGADLIVSRWAERKPGISERHRAALPQMARQILWRLENLGWVAQANGEYWITELGNSALAA